MAVAAVVFILLAFFYYEYVPDGELYEQTEPNIPKSVQGDDQVSLDNSALDPKVNIIKSVQSDL